LANKYCVETAKAVSREPWATKLSCFPASSDSIDMGTHGPYLFKDETPCSESLNIQSSFYAFSVLTLLVGRQEGHPACKKQWWGAGVVVCLEQGADLHMVQLLALPLTVSCFSKIQIGFTFLVPAHLGSPGKGAVKRVSVCVRFYEREGERGGGKRAW